MTELSDQAVGDLRQSAHSRGVRRPGHECLPSMPRGMKGNSRKPAAISTGMRRFSRTARSGKISVIWKVRAMPQRDALGRLKSGDVSAVEQDAPRGRREQAADQVEERGLAGAVRSDDGSKFAGSTVIDTSSTATRLPKAARHVLDAEQAHARILRRMMPSTPRGKNSTTRTKNRPMNDIQFWVWLDR